MGTSQAAKPYSGWTKTSNYLLDTILPKVTKKSALAGLILIKLERETVGFHREKASVSISTFCRYTSRCKDSVRDAIAILKNMGYIEITREGCGLKTTEYKINPRPNAKRHLEVVSNNKKQSHRANSPLKTPPKTPESPQTTHPPTDEKDTSIESGREQGSDALSTTPSIDFDPAQLSPVRMEPDQLPEKAPAIPVEAPEHSIPMPGVSGTKQAPAGSQSKAPEIVSEAPEKGKNLNKIKGSVFYPPPIKGSLSSDLQGPGSLKLTNKTASRISNAAKTTVDGVCFSLRSFGYELENRDHAFLCWCITAYGVEALESKILIMRQQHQRGIRFTSPFGWIRVSLARDFQPSECDMAVQRAKERAERRIKHDSEALAAEAKKREEQKVYREQNPNAGKQAYSAFLKLTKASLKTL